MSIPESDTIERPENPYASPAISEWSIDPDDVQQALAAAARVFRGIGWFGTFFSGMHLLALTAQSLIFWPQLPPMALVFLLSLGLLVAFFIVMIRTGTALQRDFDRVRRRAQVLAIMATVVSGLLLWPATVLALVRLRRCRVLLDGYVRDGK